MDLNVEVWGVSVRDFQPNKSYLTLVVPFGREIRGEIDSGTPEAIFPLKLVERLDLSKAYKPISENWQTAQGASLHICGRLEFPFLGKEGVRSILAVVSDNMAMGGPLFNLEQI